MFHNIHTLFSPSFLDFRSVHGKILNIIKHKHKWPCRIEFEAIKSEWKWNNVSSFKRFLLTLTHTIGEKNEAEWATEKLKTKIKSEIVCSADSVTLWMYYSVTRTPTRTRAQSTIFFLMSIIPSQFKMMALKMASLNCKNKQNIAARDTKQIISILENCIKINEFNGNAENWINHENTKSGRANRTRMESTTEMYLCVWV